MLIFISQHYIEIKNVIKDHGFKREEDEEHAWIWCKSFSSSDVHPSSALIVMMMTSAPNAAASDL